MTVSTMDIESPALLRELRGSTLLLQLNRPAQRNAINLPLRAMLAEAVMQARDDASVSALLIAGVGENFCGGGDLKSLSAAPRSVQQDRQRVRDVHVWFRELVQFEKPVIAAVDGAAFGAGFSLALAADFIVATPRARFCAVFARVGLVPDFGMFYLLPRIVGLQHAKNLMFSARELGADEAKALGIVCSLVAPQDLLGSALALANRFAATSTDAFGMTKRILGESHRLTYGDLAELESYAQAVSLHSDYHRDAVADFLARRPARFNWSRRDPP